MAAPLHQNPRGSHRPAGYDFPTPGPSINPPLHQFPNPHLDFQRQFPATYTERLPTGQLTSVGNQIPSMEIGPFHDNRQRSHFQHPPAHLSRYQFHGHGRHARLSIPPGPGYSYVNAPRTRFGDQQTDPRRRYQMQVNYLDSLAIRIIPSLHSLTPELQSKENLRARLVKIAREAISLHAEKRGFSIGPDSIDFKCFGSLRNGFGLPGADMDLAMTRRSSNLPKEIEDECPRVLERAFLDAGLGARLIGKTRVPIIKLCEKPSQELLDMLNEERKAWEAKQLASTVTGKVSGEETAASGESENQDSSKTDGHPIRKPSVSIDFPGSDTGIHCDINFSGDLAIYNSELLRCYSLCDERVRLMGIFVKKWAKARKINSSYHGTLCSYGYTLMVIHYLMNVAQPAVIPNLQIDYRPSTSSRKSTTTVSGYDVRFFNDEEAIRNIAQTRGFSRNSQSIGELMRGFFAYYGGGRSAPLGGFDWLNMVISIRTRGGILHKSDKGWTAYRVDDNGSRHHYLLTIEDPFEIDYNVARTVVRDGVYAIRNEFRRAHDIINSIQEIPGAGWQWRTQEGAVGEDFFAEAEDRLHLQNPRQYKRPSRPSNGVSQESTEEKQSGQSGPPADSPPMAAVSVNDQNLGENKTPRHNPTASLAYRPKTIGSVGNATIDTDQHKVQPPSRNTITNNSSTGAPTLAASYSLQGRVSKPDVLRLEDHTNDKTSPKNRSICEINPLIRRPVSEVTRRQEEMGKLFARDAATAAGKMNSMLENQKAYALRASNQPKCMQSSSDQTLVASNTVDVPSGSKYVNDPDTRDREQIDNPIPMGKERIPHTTLDTHDTEVSGSDSATVHTHLSGTSDAISISSVAITKPTPYSASSNSPELRVDDSTRPPIRRGLFVDPKQLYEMHSIHTGRHAASGVRANIYSHNQPSATSQMIDQDEHRDDLLRNLPFAQFISPSSAL
ncbi:zinc finger protein, cchc domain containing protein, putative [Paecilomyces variotii No. 5]|uniref:polynucleotide adenylyltransferase n=1 Tax=Byssochlamys spectabilis (strain No. 5 / NBRC 109023) TaxID=1356009 RepID=V5FEF7_BYSSN|nr:zinc finger protein, cchc domain containing protein, putative [Paecilomyces variotii No. 5]